MKRPVTIFKMNSQGNYEERQGHQSKGICLGFSKVRKTVLEPMPGGGDRILKTSDPQAIVEIYGGYVEMIPLNFIQFSDSTLVPTEEEEAAFKKSAKQFEENQKNAPPEYRPPGWPKTISTGWPQTSNDEGQKNNIH